MWSGLEDELKGLNDNENINKILYGAKLEEISFGSCLDANNNLQVKGYAFKKSTMQSAPNRNVRIAAIQNKFPADTSLPVEEQMEKVMKVVGEMLHVCGKASVNVVCLQEAWTMPFAFCTREKVPWCEFAEHASEGKSFKFLSEIAKTYGMVIISPILERDDAGVIWNTAVVINHDGSFLGKSRKNHIPRVGDFNESTYYMESTMGHPVFDTKFGKIAINICYGRHHPLNWMMYGLNGAEIVFNPSATIDSLSESLWSIEARNAAIANNYFSVAINRVGTERFPNEFTSADGKPAHKDFGHFFGSSYITGPDGVRTPSLDRVNDGILIADLDLNTITQVRDHWGFKMTGRYELYAKSLTKYAKDQCLLPDN